MSIEIDKLLHGMLQFDASDLHIKVGMPPGYRINGEIQPLKNLESLRPSDTSKLAQEVLGEKNFAEFDRDGDLDTSYSIPGVARFRVNAMKQRGTISMVFRKIPVEIPKFDDLGLPEICRKLAMKPRGLVLVTGPTGSGKSTTLAAMIDHRNRTDKGHILTMEDPIEFVHKDIKSYVNQREIGADTETFSSALKRALRQDPDVILVGEMRDLETISLGITAAETGHLVFGTLHTTGAIQTVDRIIDVFPPDQQQQVRVQLAETLQGVISQVLLPKTGGGRVAAHEIMVRIDALKACIREGKTAQMGNVLQTGKRHGMQLLDDVLVKLAKEGTIEGKHAVAKAHHPDVVARTLGEKLEPELAGA